LVEILRNFLVQANTQADENERLAPVAELAWAYGHRYTLTNLYMAMAQLFWRLGHDYTLANSRQIKQ
jgi:hypothetical protein